MGINKKTNRQILEKLDKSWTLYTVLNSDKKNI